MMPVYTHGDSFPHKSNQNGCRAFPSYTQVDPTKPSMVYDPWPCNGGYGYATPCNSCYNHGNFPGFYGFRPCYPQPPMPPSPVHSCGGYPIPYPEAHHISYVPPLQYSTDLPRYEYDKNRPGTYHCCGCHNHHCQQKEDRGLKIEEKGEPDVMAKRGNKKSLIPVETGNYSYPVVWIPQEYLQDNTKPLEPPKMAEQETVPCETKPNEKKNSQEQEQNLWNGWHPLDADRLRYLLYGGDGKGTQEQQKPVVVLPYNGRGEEVGNNDKKDTHANEDQKSDDRIDRMRQFPFPIVWMPSEDKGREGIGGKDIEEVNGSPKFDGNQPIKFKLIPVKHLGDDNHTDNSKVNGENLARRNETEVRDHAVTQNNIPLKQVDQPHKDVEKSDDNEKKSVTIKPSGTNRKRESSPPKSPKLPPVCLRVDPLPRRKKENANSPSLSTPAGKELSQKNSNEMKVSQDSKSHESTPTESKKVEPKRMEKKEIVVTEKTSNGEHHSDGSQVLVHSSAQTNPEVSEKPYCEKADKDGDGHQFKEAAIAKEVDTATEKTEEKNKSKESVESGYANKLEKKILLSDTEAAVRIQSSYRGFVIRRSEPLKKLKQIAEVREQLVDVRNRLQALESSSDDQIDEKQKIVIGEIIMRLLLKLDTIQGLLPSLRDIRKSLAKELTTLQEKLDYLMIVKSEESKAEVCPVELVEQEICKTENNECMSKQEAMKVDDVLGNIHGAVESHQDHRLQVVEPEGECQESSVASEPEPKEPDSEVIMEQNDEARDELSVVCEEEPMKTQEVDNAPELVQADEEEPMKTQEVDNTPELVQADEIPLKDDENDSNSGVSSPKAVDASNLDVKEENLLNELPLEVIEGEPTEFENHEQVKLKDATANGDDKAEELMAAHKDLETNELAELPTGEIVGDDLLSPAEMDNPNECQFTYETSSFEDKTPNAVEITEEVVEGKPIADIDERVKVEFVENREPVMNETPLLSKPEELQTFISSGEEGSQNVLHEDESVSSISVSIKEMSTEKNEKVNESLQAVVTEDGIKENQEEEMKVQSGDHIGYATVEKMNDKASQSEITDGEIAAGFLATPTPSEKMGSINEKQLIEENEKLREMMEKLIQAGKNQLKVISNLNGKVKNLEKKLSLRRKLSKQNRACTRRSSSVKYSNVGV
ncbi:LOW QUALITY PROTEIN: BAG family molecular chaperone regulator 6 [Humulus lupulus]|uniref:LOW QUALITY PROTEIN: BAG family molecular chaperone regulator 6 n=1 Tax=Humulus lupulus TaxID=3486 RepID=UPI002B40B923|nr:LOW QUALITY PROTEIN: BAG family molecular chaperone regulator 6 [Humulus lupulus]